MRHEENELLLQLKVAMSFIMRFVPYSSFICGWLLVKLQGRQLPHPHLILGITAEPCPQLQVP